MCVARSPYGATTHAHVRDAACGICHAPADVHGDAHPGADRDYHSVHGAAGAIHSDA